ncbi:uncharacterized protein LOC135499612 [Lineus longissimus]|uniref:uncharacterized protein LOC135499612 n=1 Tax=Lineus longissimus TaxID=88925 RepID=UPI002B4CF5A5
MDRIVRLLPGLKKSVLPDEELTKELLEKWDRLRDGKEFITMDVLADQIKKEIADNPRYKQLPQTARDSIGKYKVNAIKKRDANGDGKVSKTEFFNAEVLNKLDSILCGEGDGYDGEMSKEEVKKFIENWCDMSLEKDYEAFSKEFRPETRPAEKDLITQDVIDGLFALICPSAHERVAKVVEAVMTIFSISPAEREFQTEAFMKSSNGRQSVTRAEYMEYVRGYLKGLPFGKQTRGDLRHAVNNRMSRFHDIDRNADGTVTLGEFLGVTSYSRLLASLLDYNTDGDNVADRAELIPWVAEKLRLTEDTEDYVDAVIHEFMEEGAQELSGRALVTGLFNRAFPSDASRLKEVIQAVHKRYNLSGDDKKACADEFKALCGDKDFLDMDAYQNIAKKVVVENFEASGMPKEFWKNTVDGTVMAKVDAMKSQDRSKDGKITLTEFEFNKISDKIMNALMQQWDGGDGKLSKEELVAWIRKDLGLEGDLDLYASAVMNGMKDEKDVGVELDTWNFALRLCEVAFPADDVLVGRVIEAIKDNFALSEKEEKALLEEFKKLAGNSTTITKEVAKKQAEDELHSLYSCDMFKVLLPKRLEGIDKADVNNDGQVSADEWFRSEIFEKFFLSLHAHNSDGDCVMSRAELISWLGEKCQLTDEMYADAVIGTFLTDPSADRIKVDDLMEKLFNKALAEK